MDADNINSSTTTRLASDIGGTFTDFVWLDREGRVRTLKQPTEKTAPADPVRNTLLRLEPEIHLHGTTVATNAVLERTGADVAFVTTEGFRDLLRIARQDRPDLYNAEVTRTPPLVPPDMVFDVPERIGPNGEVLTPLTDEDVQTVIQKLRELDPDAVAICLLHAYANPEHERKLAERIEDVPTSCSSDVLPEFREYERASSTVMNAYLEPVVRTYIQQLQEDASQPLFLMKSTGGVGPSDQVLNRPLDLLLSGPAGGAIAGARLGERHDKQQLINLDIGGTSADISLVLDGEPARAPRSTIDGLPVGLPMLDVETIGAGGGSIARFDEGEALQVGPESAGADPGPICYDRGGEELTVTDAHFVLGHIGPKTELAEQLSLAPDKTLKAFEETCQESTLTVQKLATGILNVLNSRMTRAIRDALARRGNDPSEFSLVVFGGAGPLHACDLAEQLNISTILIPPEPGVFSASGILQAHQTAQRSQTVLQRFDGVNEQIEEHLSTLHDQVLQSLSRETKPFVDEPSVTSYLDLRYEGQSYEVTLPRSIASPETFHERHQQLYGYHVPDETIELVNVRVRARMAGHSFVRPDPPEGEGTPYEQRSPLYHDPFNNIPVYKRSDLGVGQEIDEPAIIEEMSSTVRLKSGWRGSVCEDGTLKLERP